MNKRTLITKEQLSRMNKIGSNVASLWGGECYSFEIDKKESKVTFSCIEHGERFTTTLAFDQLSEYDY